jgi:hypothetical protein
MDKVFAVPTEVIPSILRVVENLREDGGLRLAHLWPDDGPSAVPVVTPVHAPLSEAVVKRPKQVRPPRRTQLTSGGGGG